MTFDREQIDSIIKDTAYQVAQAIKEENSGFAPYIAQELKDIKKWQIEHQKEDNSIHEKISQFMIDAQPMLEVFKDNKIVGARINSGAKTIFLYSAGITSFIGLIWIVLKFIKLLLTNIK